MVTSGGQLAPVRNIALLKRYLDANGFQLLESLPYTRVHPVHTSNSFHYDEQTYGGKKETLAVDINWPGGGTTERNKLIGVLPVIKAFGISFIFAKDGIFDAAKDHRDHIHADCGAFTNQGKAWVKTVAKDLCVYDMQLLVRTPVKSRNNIDNTDLNKRLTAIAAASKYHGVKFPYGIKYTQAIIGAPLTGKWDTNSKTAHDVIVKKIETLLKAHRLFAGTPNPTWDANTDNAIRAFHKKY